MPADSGRYGWVAGTGCPVLGRPATVLAPPWSVSDCRSRGLPYDQLGSDQRPVGRRPHLRSGSWLAEPHGLGTALGFRHGVASEMAEAADGPSGGAGSNDARERAAGLIKDAFALARDSGREDWTRMQAGVLKNRLLLLTNGSFDEAAWGVKSFTRFLDLFPELVRVDRTFTPPHVHLIDSASVGTAEPIHAPAPKTTAVTDRREAAPWRLRRDLWSSVMDLHANGVYVWDAGEARLATPDDQELEDHPRLPTLTPEELAAWQHDFIQQEASGSSKFSPVLESWARLQTPTQSLPRHLRNSWFAALKQRVRERLEEWFRAAQIEPPENMIEPLRPRADEPRKATESTTELRSLIVRCVEVMTREELEALRLPPSAVLRARR